MSAEPRSLHPEDSTSLSSEPKSLEGVAFLHTPARPLRKPARARRTAGDRLRDALLALAEGKAELVAHTERAWASITFEGARHHLQLRFEGGEAIEAGERMIAALPDHEFAIPGNLVADATVVEARHTMLPGPRLTVTCEVLLLRDV